MARASTSHDTVRLTSLVLLLGFGGLLWGCSAVVKFKDPPQRCGDGVRDPWESCDGTDLGDGTCQQEGFTGGTLSCDNECQYIWELCNDSVCGNGRWETGEQCDPPEMDLVTCQDYGFQSGQLLCHNDCTFDTSQCSDAVCGNATCEVELGESSLSCEVDCAWQGISAGSQFTCATRKDSSLWCWGANDYGKLGDSTGVDSPWPVRVALPGVGRVSAGRDHVCAVSEGYAFCWGQGSLGKLGYGNVVDRYEPQPLSLAMEWVVVGGDASCSISGDNSVWCWGANSVGQLGIGNAYPGICESIPCADLPMEITGWGTGEAISVASAADGETHVCALQGGAAWCWGRNDLSQTGRAFSTEDGTAPALVDGWLNGAPNLLHIAAGRGFTCASDNVATWCWGDNASGQLGNGSMVPDATWVPQAVLGFSEPVAHLSAGVGHACASADDGRSWCWGSNSSGQIGNDSTVDRNLATAPMGLPGHVENISAGADHTCAVVSIAEPYHLRIYCWGANDRGQLGDGTTLRSLVPVEVVDPPAPSSR